ncbi:hypothetical protein F5B19DRAFT_494987 [Rostrohypoxylon terebratum]|nr:hypothetical protein F5B19DRAFT_494987 [Rostrohypoxylon terebratum]
MNILEEHAVPIAASINGRQPTTEAEWVKAEMEDGPMPEVYEHDIALDPAPMMKLLIDATPPPSIGKDDVNHLLHDVWMTRIIIPILKQSTFNHRRWTTLFLKRNSFKLPIDKLPKAPLNPRVFADLFKAYPKSFPSSAFQAIKDVVITNIFPDTDIALVNKAIRSNVDLLQSNAGKHWLSVWSTAGDSFSLGVYQLADLMFEKAMNDSDKELAGATTESIQVFMLNLMSNFAYKLGISHLNAAIDRIGFSKRIYSSETHEFFQSNCVPVLEKIIELLRRTGAQNSTRKLSDFSEILPMKLELLKGKHWHDTSKTPSSADIREFAKDVISLIEDIAEDGQSHEDKWRLLKRAALQQFHKKYFVLLATEFCLLNKVETGNRLADYLRFELVQQFVTEAEDPGDDSLGIPLGTGLKGWRTDPDESVRIKVESIIEILKGLPIFSSWNRLAILFNKYADCSSAFHLVAAFTLAGLETANRVLSYKYGLVYDVFFRLDDSEHLQPSAWLYLYTTHLENINSFVTSLYMSASLAFLKKK